MNKANKRDRFERCFFVILQTVRPRRYEENMLLPSAASATKKEEDVAWQHCSNKVPKQKNTNEKEGT